MMYNGVIRVSEMRAELDDTIKIIQSTIFGRHQPPEDLKVGSSESLRSLMVVFRKFRGYILRMLLKDHGYTEYDTRYVIRVLRRVLARVDKAIQQIRRVLSVPSTSVRPLNTQKGRWLGGTCLLSRCDLLV